MADEQSTGNEERRHDLVIHRTTRQPTLKAVNATMARLGIDVEWSEEAVKQLTEAAAAMDEYLAQHPEQAEALVREPESVVQAMVDDGFLTTPVDALLAALAPTREQRRKRGRFDITREIASVRFEDTTYSTSQSNDPSQAADG